MTDGTPRNTWLWRHPTLKLLAIRSRVFVTLFLVLLALYVGYRLFIASHGPDSYVQVRVWLDRNANGEEDTGEPPLAGICIWAGYGNGLASSYTYHAFSSWQEICERPMHRTDNEGKWSDWFPGGSCDEIHILINPPEGYQLTTPAVVNDCTAKFGLIQGTSPSQIQVPVAEQYIKGQVTINRIKQLLPLGVIVVLAAAAAFILVRPRKQ